jgi:hypothetical protein
MLLYSPLYYYLLFATSRFFLPSEALVSKSNSFYRGKKKSLGIFLALCDLMCLG